MSNHWIDLGQGVHMQRYGKRRNRTLHVHLDPASSLHRHFDNQQHIRNMLTKGQLQRQQHSTGL